MFMFVAFSSLSSDADAGHFIHGQVPHLSWISDMNDTLQHTHTAALERIFCDFKRPIENLKEVYWGGSQNS